MAQRTSMRSTLGRAALLACGLAFAVSLPLHAQKLYRYVDSSGQVHYTDRPQDATGRAADQLNNQGMVIKHIDAPPTPEEIAEREAAKKKQEEEEKRVHERKRQDEILRARYGSAGDIELARRDTLMGLDQAIHGAEARIADLSKDEKRAKAEVGRYPAGKVPKQAQDDLAATEQEIAAQRDFIAKKKAERAAADARFDEDKRRYAELTSGRAGSASAPAKAAPSK